MGARGFGLQVPKLTIGDIHRVVARKRGRGAWNFMLSVHDRAAVASFGTRSTATTRSTASVVLW